MAGKVIARIALDEDEGSSRPLVDIGGTNYALKNVTDFDLGEYGRLMRLTEYVQGLNLEDGLNAETAERLDITLDESLGLLFWDKLPQELLDRLRDVQKLSILQAFTGASAGSFEPTTSTTRSRPSRRSMAAGRATG